MIAILLAGLLAQTSTTSDPLDAIGVQSLPRTGCAAYLWNSNDRKMVAMAVAEPAMLRLAIDGKTIDLARADQTGAVALGLGASITYAGSSVTAKLDMSIVPRENLVAGAQVPEGSLLVDRAGHDTVIVPVAGLVGCAT
jgi:hypothetical protein